MVRYHSGQAAQWLDICGRNGITLNPEKFIFAQDVVEFEITNDTVCPCRRCLRAITEFPTPKNITDVRSWFGLFNQVAYAFSMAERMLPFGDLLKPATPFHWDDGLDQLFEESKTAITTEINIINGAKIFDKTKPTCLATDWSRDCIGFWLFQNHYLCSSTDFFAVEMDGKSCWWVADSPTLQNLDMHQSKGRLWRWQMPLIRQDILFGM